MADEEEVGQLQIIVEGHVERSYPNDEGISCRMNVYYLVYGFVLAGVGIVFIDNVPIRRVAQKLYFVFAIGLLAVFAGFRSPEVDNDYGNYVFWFNLIRTGVPDTAAWFRDPGFAALSYAVSRLHLPFSAVPLVYAALALAATAWFSLIATTERWVTLLFYLLVCLYYTVGEMTQIRVAVAQPLMAIAIYRACEGHKRQAVGLYCIALLFHFSVIIALPFLVLILLGVRFRSRAWVFALVPLSLIAVIGMRPMIDFMMGLYRVSEAMNGGAPDHAVVVVSWYALGHLLLIALFVLVLWKRLSFHERWATIACGFGLSLFVIFSWSSGLSDRFLNLFDFYWILLMVVFIERLRGVRRLVWLAFLVAAGLALFVKSLQFVEPYSMGITSM